ncbi:hypothetical protein DSECCO2_535060 [anaerobic digester metagenome]
MSALTPSFARRWAAVPPELLSFIPPVSGLLAPTDKRPEFAAFVPANRPGANTNLFLLPNGLQVGSTSSEIIVEVNPLPPRVFHLSGTSSIEKESFDIFTR